MATPLQDGAADFARALLGGGQIEADAQLKRQMLYDQQDSGRAELDRKITEALLKRGERTAVLERPGAYQRTLGVDPQTGTDLATLQLAGNENIDAMQKFNLRNAALRALHNPDLDLAPGNAELAALDGKPLQHLTTQGVNVIANRYSNAPGLDLSQLGESQVRANDARAAASNAQANLSNVKAAGGGFAPSSGGRGGINITRADNGKKATYTGSAVGGAKGVEQAKAILKDLVATGGDPMGYSVGSVKRDMADDGEAGLIAAREPGSLRFITGSHVRDIPGVVPQAPSTAPVAAPVVEAAAAPATAVPPAPQRVRGQVYPTPRGPMVWTGTGWMPAP